MSPLIRSSGARAARGARVPFVRPCLEVLEDRLLLSIDPIAGLAGIAVPGVEVLAPTLRVGTNLVTPNGGPGQPGGLSPQQVSQAYSFNQITFNNGAIAGNGS